MKIENIKHDIIHNKIIIDQFAKTYNKDHRLLIVNEITSIKEYLDKVEICSIVSSLHFDKEFTFSLSKEDYLKRKRKSKLYDIIE